MLSRRSWQSDGRTFRPPWPFAPERRGQRPCDLHALPAYRPSACWWPRRSRHGGLRLLIGLHADLVDAVCHVLLLRSLERFGQRVIKHHALLCVGLQLVDQHHLRCCLVLQAVDPGLSLFDIAFKGLAVGPA